MHTCRVSFHANLRFVSPSNMESLFVAEIQHFLHAHESASAIHLAVCELYPAKCGSQNADMMTAATHGVQPEAHAVATFELDTEQVIAVDKGKLHGIMYGNSSELV